MQRQRRDRRVERTQALLRDALVSLIQEKPYDSIAVKEILDRANVGRSTFYMHFRDKDDLLVLGIHDLIGSVHRRRAHTSQKASDGIIWFSLPIFEYIEQHRRTSEAKMGRRGRAIIHEHLQRVLGDLIADDVKKRLRTRRKPGHIPPDLLIQYVASTFTLVLNWWVETRSPLSPREINDCFRALIAPTLEATCD